MSNYREIIESILRRMVPAIVVGALGWWLLTSVNESDSWRAMPRLLLGMAFLVLAAIILGPPVARLVAEPFGGLFYPVERYSRPQPVYGIPESRRVKGLYEEAIVEFEKIAEDYPDEVRPYTGMIDIAICNLEDPDRARQMYQRGMSVLKRDKDKETLAKKYSAIRSRVNAKPETVQVPFNKHSNSENDDPGP